MASTRRLTHGKTGLSLESWERERGASRKGVLDGGKEEKNTDVVLLILLQKLVIKEQWQETYWFM